MRRGGMDADTGPAGTDGVRAGPRDLLHAVRGGRGFLPVTDQQTGRESVRWLYEDPKEGRRLVVGVDKDDGVPTPRPPVE